MKNYDSLLDFKNLSETALESSLAGYWDWDMTTNYEFLSPRFKEMFGYQDHEMENSPESWQKIAFEEDLPGMFQAFEQHVQSKGEIPFNSIVRYHHKTGRTIWVRCNGKIVEWAEDGSPLRAVGCHVDITKEKERELELQRIVEERNVLLKEVHHRVKNNLQLLLSLSRLKEKEGKVDTIELEDSINSIARAYEAIYKSDGLEKISIRNYVQEISNPLISGQKVSLNLASISDNYGIDFLIPNGLIITELINNSLKHGFTNEIDSKEIAIKISRSHNSLHLSYSDNGVGFPSDILNSNDLSEHFGLSIIKGLSEQLDGNVSFTNADQGVHVQIDFP